MDDGERSRAEECACSEWVDVECDRVHVCVPVCLCVRYVWVSVCAYVCVCVHVCVTVCVLTQRPVQEVCRGLVLSGQQ